MTKNEQLFHEIAKLTPNTVEDKLFGAMSIKASNGKTAAFFWNEDMTFKLDETIRQKALKISGAKIGSHIYAPEKPMKGWVCVPSEHTDSWAELSDAAVKFINKLD